MPKPQRRHHHPPRVGEVVTIRAHQPRTSAVPRVLVETSTPRALTHGTRGVSGFVGGFCLGGGLLLVGGGGCGVREAGFVRAEGESAGWAVQG